ncbi:hypothetical protein GUITHDRAFT_134757 [Guillardia theta CCMP2712]|uniref:Uncharacterized protein n=1 Tax=Guillardia theta (strain CCMP2712) TaxID=905079 RepID=L1JSL5_GUITC|nr:hypothetical protein GUITHDRAFT_134757 [Guillardia theta CCMP2712]EKX51269.1 hypothetical protein GUITHDRAFT_134757 [Guillardia theta CCMP2712]|eukprot:XP_005838249.1 hypothetical protein GUITHDRAFT_134757 [Guillardia theta CCMP2712]
MGLDITPSDYQQIQSPNTTLNPFNPTHIDTPTAYDGFLAEKLNLVVPAKAVLDYIIIGQLHIQTFTALAGIFLAFLSDLPSQNIYNADKRTFTSSWAEVYNFQQIYRSHLTTTLYIIIKTFLIDPQNTTDIDFDFPYKRHFRVQFRFRYRSRCRL